MLEDYKETLVLLRRQKKNYIEKFEKEKDINENEIFETIYKLVQKVKDYNKR